MVIEDVDRLKRRQRLRVTTATVRVATASSVNVDLTRFTLPYLTLPYRTLPYLYVLYCVLSTHSALLLLTTLNRSHFPTFLHTILCQQDFYQQFTMPCTPDVAVDRTELEKLTWNEPKRYNLE